MKNRIKFQSQFSEGFSTVCLYDNSENFIDEDGKFLLKENTYGKCHSFSNGYALVSFGDHSYNYYDKNGELVFPYDVFDATEFEYGIAFLRFNENDDFYVPIDENLNFVDIGNGNRIKFFQNSGDGFFSVAYYDKNNLLNRNYLTPNKKLLLKDDQNIAYCGRFNEGYSWITKKENGKTINCAIDKEGNILFEFPYGSNVQFFSCGYYLVENAKGYMNYFSTKGEKLFPDGVLNNDSRPFHNGFAITCFRKNNSLEYNYIDANGKMLLKNNIKGKPFPFNQEFGYFYQFDSGRTNIILKDGTIIKLNFEKIKNIDDENDFYPIENETRNFIYYANSEGKVLNEKPFREGKCFNGGFALVRDMNYCYNYIDRKGNFIIKNKYASQVTNFYKNFIFAYIRNEYDNKTYLVTKDGEIYNDYNEYLTKSLFNFLLEV